jgi:hypothetical protein
LTVGFTAAAVVHETIEALDEKRLPCLHRQLAVYKLLIIDEFGDVPLSTTGALVRGFQPVLRARLHHCHLQSAVPANATACSGSRN